MPFYPKKKSQVNPYLVYVGLFFYLH